MSNYLKGFGVSLLLHGFALGLGLWFTLGVVSPEQELLIVDFSSVSIGKPQEGGALPGAMQADEEEPAPEPEAEAEPVQPEPEPVVSKKAVPVKESPKPKVRQKPKPAPAPSVPAASGGTGTASASPEGRGTGPDSGSGREEGLAQGYLKANFNYILVRIRRNLDYPSQARRMSLTGVSKFSFIIKLDGSIENVNLEESSGHKILDEAARKAIMRAAPFPAPPVPARIIIPISFRLT